MVRKKKDRTELIRCACGLCDELIPRYYYRNGKERKYKKGHSTATKDRREIIECGCGCKELMFRYNEYGYERKYIHNHYWNNNKPYNYQGWFIDDDGYKRVYKPDHHFADSKGYVLEHRLVWEEYYNCCLLPWIEIHHKNISNLSQWENKHDNRIENLEALTRTQHRILHHKGIKNPKKSKNYPFSKYRSYAENSGYTPPLENFS